MSTSLDVEGKSIENPTADDIARAMAGPRDDDWYLTLNRGDDDSMEVMIDGGGLWVECQEGEAFLQARSYVDEAAVKEMLAAFRDGDPRWRDLAAWAAPARTRREPPPGLIPVVVVSALVAISLVVAAIATGNAGWVVVLFALAFPGVIAVAVWVKLAEVKRAAAWTKGNARIVRSELATEMRHGKEVKVPRVEYEFPVGFHRWRGRRISLGEFVGSDQAGGLLQRYRVGASAPVYYDPADPSRSVLERELPPFFPAIWGLVAVLTAIVLGCAYWFLLR